MTDQQAIERFMNVQDRLFRYINSIMRSSEDAEDIVQDTFIKLIKTVRAKKQLENLEAWCMKVARNRAFDLLKSKERQGIVTDKIGLYQPKQEHDFTHKDINDERWEVVKRCIDELPEKYRRIIQLRDIEGLRYQEIADLTGMSLSQVKVTIHRARQHLKEKVFNTIPYYE